ncbi:hypothetical protein HFN89_05740 [Rhizobium laguerreae]|nr:hypothetical protein [Rhizobium laguerreae]
MLDKKDVAIWLAGRGFETVDGCTFVAPIPNGTFEIELSERSGRYALCMNGDRKQGRPTPYHLLTLDENADSLHGLGLYTLFALETFEGDEPPVWFSQQMRNALQERTPVAAAPAPRVR